MWAESLVSVENIKYSTVNSSLSSVHFGVDCRLDHSEAARVDAKFILFSYYSDYANINTRKRKPTLGSSARIFLFELFITVSINRRVSVERTVGGRWWSWKKHEFCIMNSKYISLPFIYTFASDGCAVSFDKSYAARKSATWKIYNLIKGESIDAELVDKERSV